MQTVFVTGGSGFIGRHLTRKLLCNGVRVRCLVRSETALAEFASDGLERVIGDLAEPDSYAQAIQGCDTVIHLAGLVHATSRDDLYRINGDACGVLADVCRRISEPPHLIHVSSLAAAGPPPSDKRIRQESDQPEPISDYGRSKRQGETELQERAEDLPITVLRPGIVYGPGDVSMAQLFRTIYRFRLHFVIGFRTPPLSLVFVDDLVQFISNSAGKLETVSPSPDSEHASRGYYFLCDDAEYPNYSELGSRIASSLRRRVIVCPLSRRTGVAVGAISQTVDRMRGRSGILNVDKVREAVAHSWASSSEKAREHGFQAVRPLDDRLAETANWFLENGWI